MLPTLAVILWSYGIYALISFILQRKGGNSRGRNRTRKINRYFFAVGIIGVGLILFCCFPPEKTDQPLKLAGFLGTVYAEGWSSQVDRVDYPPVKTQNHENEEQPAYSLLHPETPPSQIKPEKKLLRPRPRAIKKLAGPQDKSGKTAKVAKSAVYTSKKDKVIGKSRANKKKKSSAVQANAG